LFLLVLATQPVEAQQVAAEDAGTLVHYAYAPLLGTGLYRIGDQSAFVFSIPIGYQRREPAAEKPGIYLHLPVSIGLYDFDFEGIIETRTEDIATVSFVPGVEMQYLVRENWLLKPFANLGWGTDLANDDSAWIYAFGLRSLTDFHLEQVTLSLGAEYLWSGYDPKEGSSDHINRFGLGLNARFPLHWRIGDGDASLMAHAIVYYYANELQFPSTRGQGDTFDVRREYELGMALGRDPGIAILGIEFDRVGIGYRFGDKLSAIVLVGSFPF
jgi:hypothetical protein